MTNPTGDALVAGCGAGGWQTVPSEWWRENDITFHFKDADELMAAIVFSPRAMKHFWRGLLAAAPPPPGAAAGQGETAPPPSGADAELRAALRAQVERLTLDNHRLTARVERLDGALNQRIDEMEQAKAALQRTRAALLTSKYWHEREARALGIQPVSTDAIWRRSNHQAQAEAIDAALADPAPAGTPPDDAREYGSAP